MFNTALHDWNLQLQEAIQLQQKLAASIIREDRLGEVHFVAGVDMAINEEEGGLARAAVVLLTYPDLGLVEQHIYQEPLRMPYVPGLLSFREAPCVLGAFRKLRQLPDLVMVDGAGIAHPRRLGIASHLGLWLDLPTIGCAKSILVGKYEKERLGENAGLSVPIVDKKGVGSVCRAERSEADIALLGGEIVGAAVRTRTKVNPMIISLGHRISLETSIRYVLACCKGYRLPEPTRQADKLSKDNVWREPEGEQQASLWG